ncbi:MAG: hypothetical protein MJ252_30590 [archaeon]|nr:hypothetical protein [archaeon]
MKDDHEDNEAKEILNTTIRKNVQRYKEVLKRMVEGPEKDALKEKIALLEAEIEP